MILVEPAERLEASGSPSDERSVQSRFSRASCVTGLRRIMRPGTDLVIWQREIRQGIVAELATLVLDALDDILFCSPTNTLDEALSNALAEANYPDVPDLHADIAMLARQQAALTSDNDIRIRLEIVETDACRKFHADYVKARTITTYLGSGTQWIETTTPDLAGCVDGPPIRQIDTGAVAIFKGRLWEERPGILHRSPPIESSNEKRVVLVIDPVPGKSSLRAAPGETKGLVSISPLLSRMP